MKKYLIERTLEAEPMYQYEAEAKMGREIDNPYKEDLGYLVCDMETLKFDWIKESQFKGRAFDTLEEKMYVLYDRLKHWETFFKEYTKKQKSITSDERQQVYRMNRHIKALNLALTKILNINTLKRTSE